MRAEQLDGGDDHQKMRELGNVVEQVGRDFREVVVGKVTRWKDVYDVGMLRNRKGKKFEIEINWIV